MTEVLVLDRVLLSHTGPLEPGGKHREEPVTEGAPGPARALPIGELVPIVEAAIGPVGRFGSAFWRQSRFESATGSVRLGLGDPVLTGELCGYYWASRFLLLASRVDVRLEPDFDRLVLELDLTVRVKVEHPLLILFAGLALVRDPAIQDAVRFVREKRPGGAAA